jgi:WhiB family redox-sensing transcriptional regulator
MPDPLAWQEDALCAETDLEAFFPERGGSVRDAMRVCGSCGVVAKCLAYALAQPENPDGVWGGTTKRERAKLRPDFIRPDEFAERDHRLRSMHEMGWSDEQIGQELKVSGRQIGRIRNKLGLAPNFVKGVRVA